MFYGAITGVHCSIVANLLAVQRLLYTHTMQHSRSIYADSVCGHATLLHYSANIAELCRPVLQQQG
jgi:hypothetical protein